MRSHFPIVELGKHVRQVSQRNRAEAAIEVFSVTNSEGFTRSTDYFSKEVFSKDVSNYKVVRPGQFAYNPSRINVGSIDYLRHNSPVLVSPLYVVFEGDEELQADFLLRYLKSNWGNAQIRSNTEGAVRDSLKFKGLESIKIPLPPLNDQIRIAHLLGKVEGLIAQRKQHLQQLDDLLKSVFLEMFGDPVRNEKKWITHQFSSLFSLHPRIGTTTPVSNDGTIPVIRVGELGEFQVKFSNCKKVNLEKNEMDKCRVTKGDILLARAIASQGHLGKASLITHLEQDTAFDSHVMRIRFKAELTAPEFAYHWLKSSGGRTLFLKASSRTSVQFNINSKQISSITMPLPPIDLQNQFAIIVEKVEGIKTHYQQSLAGLANLYGALSQKAFKGELDLSRVSLTLELKR